MPDRHELERMFLDHLGRIERIIASLCRRHGLAGEDAEDVDGWVKLKLVEDDYAILRKFRGESALPTYLTVVIAMLFRDYRASRWGRWRPSAEARRRGDVAVRLETLVYREGHTFDQAVRLLRSAGETELSDRELADLLDALPQRGPMRPVEVGLTAVAEASAPVGADDVVVAREAGTRRRSVEEALRQGLERLPAEDRLILRMRYWEQFSLADVARGLGLRQKPIYRRVEKSLRRLRNLLEAEGVTPEDVAAVLDEPRTEE